MKRDIERLEKAIIKLAECIDSLERTDAINAGFFPSFLWRTRKDLIKEILNEKNISN